LRGRGKRRHQAQAAIGTCEAASCCCCVVASGPSPRRRLPFLSGYDHWAMPAGRHFNDWRRRRRPGGGAAALLVAADECVRPLAWKVTVGAGEFSSSWVEFSEAYAGRPACGCGPAGSDRPDQRQAVGGVRRAVVWSVEASSSFVSINDLVVLAFVRN
jgi:hypothetical protein